MVKVFAINLTICLIIGLLQTANALEINFNPTGSVNDSIIRLGDIVNFDEETEMTKALATLTVGQSPAPGEQSSLRSLSIKDYLVSSQSLPQDIRWTGSPTVTVHRQGMNIGSEKILAIIAEFIKKNQNNLPEAEIRFVPGSLPLPFILPIGDLTYEVIPSNPDIISSSRFSIIFRIDNTVVRNMSVRGNIEALTQVVVCVGSMTRGSIIRPEHLTMAMMDISSLANPGLELSDLVGKRLQRNLRAGSPVLLSMVESLPVVQRGERVKIVINSGPLHLTATGLAHSDGIMDQMIRVQNINSNKIIYCRVAAPGLVEVIL